MSKQLWRIAAAAAAGCAASIAWAQQAEPSPSAAKPEPQPAGQTAKPPAAAAEQQPAIPEGAANLRPPTGIEEELAQITPGMAMKRRFDELAAKTNLRLGVANTILFQQASGGPGNRSGAAGDLDLLAKWTAIGAGTKDTGLVAFAAEYRYQIGDRPPSTLGSEIGTLTPTTNSFSERPMVVKELYWDQRLFEDRFRYAVGRIDPENLFGGHRLQSANNFFLNKVFSGNVSVAYPGQGLAAAAQVKPVEWLFITGGITDANGKATINNIEGFFKEHEFLTFAEVGFTPKIEGLGVGRYRLSFWHVDAREDAGKPSDRGITISCDQDIGDDYIVFARYGYADADVTAISNSVQAGVGIKGVAGKDNMLGLAAAWSQPEDGSKRDEKVLEVFQRFQITETSQFTVGLQGIFEPSNAPDDDALAVFSARLRIAF